MELGVFQTGNIFVFTGMLATCNSEDELGVILGHEMAHALLGHAVSGPFSFSFAPFFVSLLSLLVVPVSVYSV